MLNFRKLPIPEVPSLFERQLKNLEINNALSWWDKLSKFAQMTDAWNMNRPDLPGSSEEWRDLHGLIGAGDRPVGPLPLFLTDQPTPLPKYYEQPLQFRPPTYDQRGLDAFIEDYMKKYNKGPVI